MKRSILLFALIIFCSYASAQIAYSYAPADVQPADMSALGGCRSQFVQGIALFDPATDHAWARLKGRQVKGVRCFLRADYKQARQKRSGIIACVGSPTNIVNTTYADLVEGWNDVAFSEPLTIGDDKLYLGVQVYETLGTPYPLVAYAPATVPQSCIVNQAKKSWEEFIDRGTLLIGALLDEDAAPLLEHCVYAQNTSHPQTVAPDTDFQGGLYLHNFSSEPVASVTVAMQGEGDDGPTLRTVTLSEPIPPYGSTVINTMLHSGLTQGTNVDWTATVTQVNGATAQAARPGTTKLFVTQDNFIRVPLVEEFTSQACVACPQMSYFLEKAFEQYKGSYVYVAHHSGFHEDTFTTAPDRELTYVFGGYANEYNPAIMYNRSVFEGETTIVFGITEMSADPYLAAVAFAAQQPAKAEVMLQHNDTEVTITGRVAHDLIGTPLYISCYLVEDGISHVTYPQTGLDDDDAPADLKQVFRHNGVILHHYNKAPIGDELNTDADGLFSVTYPMVAKNGFGGKARRIVAFVHQVNKNDLRQNEVLNATQEWLNGAPDGIRDMEDGRWKMEDDIVNSKSLNGKCYDLFGRCVANNSSTLPKGIYIIGCRKVVLR